MTKARDIADSNLGDLTVDTNTLYVDSSNNRVGIGTSSPAYKLETSGGGISSTDTAGNARSKFEVFTNGQTSNQVTLGQGFAAPTDNIGFLYNRANAPLVFGTSNSEAMRIDSSGNLLVGTTSMSLGTTSNSSPGFGVSPSNFCQIARSSTGGKLVIQTLGQTVASAQIAFGYGSSTVGSISSTSSATSYNTSSDERLKENIADAQPASDLIDGIQVREFDWKADGEHQRYGMIAQELETVAPEAVTKGETEDDMWAVDYSKLVPMLVKEIQDLRKRVAELEATA